MRHFVLVIATIALLATSSGPALADDGNGKGKRIYDSLEIAGNVPSQAFEATSTSEFGDQITFAGRARTLAAVTVTLSSWGCQTGHWYSGDCATQPGATFDHPITLNIYQLGAGNAPGALIATRTQTFAIPYRPSADARCGDGRWFDRKGATCFNGFETFVTFEFDSQQVTLPNTVIYGIAYNTSHYGAQPIGESAACYTSSGGCGYDSLNVGFASKVKVGSKPLPDTAYLSSTWSGAYCDKGLAGTGFLRLDSPTSACYVDSSQHYIPAVRFTARGGDQGDDEQGDDNNGQDD